MKIFVGKPNLFTDAQLAELRAIYSTQTMDTLKSHPEADRVRRLIHVMHSSCLNQLLDIPVLRELARIELGARRWN